MAWIATSEIMKASRNVHVEGLEIDKLSLGFYGADMKAGDNVGQTATHYYAAANWPGFQMI